jgi:hypothetical protein
VAEEVSHRAGHPGSRVPRAEHHAVDAREHERPRAHRARLERDVERAAVEAPAAERGGGGAQREHLGVGGGVLVAHGAVGGGRDHRVAAHDDRADGHVAPRRPRRRERAAHVRFVVSRCHPRRIAPALLSTASV